MEQHLIRGSKLVLWHYGYRHIAIAALVLAGLTVAVVTKMLRPLVRIRIGTLHNYRNVGHLSWNTELYLRRRASGPAIGRVFDLLLTGPPANRQMLRMIKRRIPVIENKYLIRLLGSLRAVPNAFEWVDLKSDYNRYDEFNNVPPQLYFTADEELRGLELVESMGIESGSAFVCFHCRDNAYSPSGLLPGQRKGEDMDYRNCSLANYIVAAEYLTTLGIPALRMGSITLEKLHNKNKLIIDYADRYQSDFGDIFLLAKCKFFLGNTAGLAAVAYIFDVPGALANWIPIGFPPQGNDDIFILKKLWHIESKRFLTFQEMLQCGGGVWMDGNRYRNAGLEAVENTADEILELGKEMNGRLDQTWNNTEEDDFLQKKYRDLFAADHFCFGFPSRVGADFLRRNRELLAC